MTVNIDVSGVERLGGELTKISGGLGALGARAVRKAAHDIEADAKATAPVDTGFLRNSISTSMTGDGRFGEMSAEIGPTAAYGIYVELGTSKMAAEPYLAPAFDRHIDGLTKALGQLGTLA